MILGLCENNLVLERRRRWLKMRRMPRLTTGTKADGPGKDRRFWRKSKECDGRNDDVDEDSKKTVTIHLTSFLCR